MSTTSAPTWASCRALEPRLADLEHRVATLGITDAHPDYWREYETWKRELSRLVGWDARRPELRTTDCYDACHRHLLSIMEGT